MLHKFFSIIVVVALAAYCILATSAISAFAQEPVEIAKVDAPISMNLAASSHLVGNEVLGLSNAARIVIMAPHRVSDKDADDEVDATMGFIGIVVFFLLLVLICSY